MTGLRMLLAIALLTSSGCSLIKLDEEMQQARQELLLIAGHLHPAAHRKNLTIETGAMVQRVDIAGNRATGLTYVQGGQTHRVMAAREVVLCGGAINSPQMLMLSGIGPEAELQRHGIAVRCHAPGVGQNLQDHVDLMMQWHCTKPVTLARLANPLVKLAAGAEWLMKRTGPVASNIWEAGGLVKTDASVASPNVQYHFGPVAVDYIGDKIVLKQGFQLHLSQLRQTSRGRLTLISADPAAAPRIEFDFLSTEHDQREMVEGVKLARHIVAQPAFAPFRGSAIYPDVRVQSDADILDFVRNVSETEFHPSCTCRMGNDALAVTGPDLKVHGIENLRVVDASVMPAVISANLNATVMMIAEKAADMMTGRAPLAPFRPRFAFDG